MLSGAGGREPRRVEARRRRRHGSVLLYAVVTIAFLVLGILALGFGVDSRDGFEEDDWHRRG